MTPEAFPARCKMPKAALAARAVLMVLAALMACGAAQAQKPSRWVSGELLVGFRAGVGPSDRHAFYSKQGTGFIRDVGKGLRVVRVRVPAASEDAVMRRLARLPQVKFVEKNYEYQPALVPDDPLYASQWHLPMILAPEAWDLNQGGPGAVIAILDSGVDATHPEFAGKLVAGYNTYSNSTDTTDAFGHGTEVAGVAGVLTNNGEGIAGIASASPIMPVRVTNATGGATAASIADGIVWATDHGARVVNLSFDAIAGNATIRTAAEYAFNHGTLVVAASGNCACADPTLDNPFVLSVSGTDESDAVAYFSTTGPFVDLSAPGANILTTARFGLYFAESGTSLASPIVAGVAAQMFSANQALTPAEAVQLLESTANDLGAVGYDPGYGYGRVNAFAAVSTASTYTPPKDSINPTATLSAPADGATVSAIAVIDVAADDNVGVVKVDLYVDGAFFDSDASAPYSFAWDTSALADGAHTLQAVASDAAGNSGNTVLVSVTVSNTPVDGVPPTVFIDSPAAGATVSGTTLVTGRATDLVGVTQVDLYVDGVLNASAASAPYSFSWNTTQSANGSHVLRVVAADAAGNAGEASLTVNVANKANHAPVAMDDKYIVTSYTRWGPAPRSFAVLGNDRDVDWNLDRTSVTIVHAPTNGGIVKVNTNGTVFYLPAKGYRGVETFGYVVKDKLGASSNIATVTVTVRDAPHR